MFDTKEIKIIDKICNTYKFEYIIYDDMVYIKSKFDSWRILKINNEYKLYHKNRSKHTCNLNQNSDSMDTYHFQSECKYMNKLDYMVKYLHYHDEGLLKRYKTKTTVDAMFEKITNPKRFKIT